MADINNENSLEKICGKDTLQEIFGSISCGVFACTFPEYALILKNSEAERLLGKTECETLNGFFEEFLKERVYPDDREKVSKASETLKKTGDSVSVDYRIISDGEIRFVRSKVKLLGFSDGGKYILCTLLDCTEQALLNASLDREKKAYRDALLRGSEYSFFFDVTEGMITEEYITAHGVNIFKILGLSVPVSYDELLEKYKNYSALEFADESMEKFFTSKGLLEAYEQGVTNAVTEYYSPMTDMYVRTSCLLSEDSANGHIYGAVVAEDISDLRRKEQQEKEDLQKANDEINNRIDAILDGISGGLKIIDPDTLRYIYVSRGAAELQGYSPEEFIEKFSYDIKSNLYHEDRERAFEEACGQMDKKGFYNIKYRIVEKGGKLRWIIERGKLVADSETGKKLWYTLMQDVTELEERNSELANVLSMQEEMAESLSSGFFAYTIPQREILLFNCEAHKLFSRMGFTDENQISDIMKIIPESEREYVCGEVSRLKNAGDKVSYTFHPITADLSYMSVRCDTKLLCFASGQKYILSSITDITEQELTETRLDEESRRYRNALAYDSVLFFGVDLTDGYVRDAMISRFGTNMADIVGIKLPVTYNEFAAVWLSDKRIVTDSENIEIVRSREKLIESCNRGSAVIEAEYHIPSNGKFYRFLTVLYKLGDHVNANFIIYDVTLSRTEDMRRRAIIGSLGRIYPALYYFTLDIDRFMVIKQHSDVADALENSDRYSVFSDVYINRFVEEEFKDSLTKFLNPDTIRKKLSDKDYVSIEFRSVNLGWCRITLVVCDRDMYGNASSVVFAGYVIEKQKQAELAQKEALKAAYESANMANSAKTDFLANMSHDIRTPMNAIIGLTAIAGTHLDDREKVADCLSKITVSSKHLLGIINDVLDMSKIESGKIDLQEEEFSLPELIDNLLTMSKPQIKAKDHNLTVSIKGIEHERVFGDSQRIQQAFMNLMSNAVKYTPEGGNIVLSITEKTTNKPRIGCYEFIFEDNGIGMSEEFQKHLFEPFARATDDSRVEKIQGTGLGMPITRNIIQMMNGNIKVKSKLGEGTKITVTIFLKLKNEEEDISYDKFVDLKVLVADDDEISCVYTCQILKEIGIDGEWVTSGEEAVEKTAEHHENGDDLFAVILDWKMPGMDGVKTTKAIRKRVGDDVPIIIISAYDWSDIELEARAAGANAFISKPLFKSRMVHLFNEFGKSSEPEKTESELASFEEENFNGYKALLVEDNELNAEIAGEILGMAGLEVEYAVNGKEAVDIVSGENGDRFDIIFMDVQMPVMKGYEAVRAIRALSGYYPKSVPIIAMTANAFAEDVTAAKNAGMNEHIAKPLDFTQLMKVLKKWLSKKD